MKVLKIATITACALLLSPLATSAQTFNFKQIKTESEFRELVVDKKLVAGWGTLVIHSNGSISGKVGKNKLAGAWKWSGKYFCINFRIGNQKDAGTDCQKMSVDGDHLQSIKNKGKGDGAVLTITK